MSDALQQLGKEVSRALGDGTGPERLARQRTRLISSTQQGARRRWLGTWRSIPVFAAVCVLAISVALLVSSEILPDDRVLCTIGDRPISSGQWVTARDGETVHLRFSEGSRVTVEPHALARLIRLEPDSVHFLIEAGTVDSDIAPDRRVEWTFLAGPYRVIVLGTRLHVEWEPDRQELIVSVTRGRVRVIGASISNEGVLVTRGQTLRVRDQSVLISRTNAETSVPPWVGTETVEPEPPEPPVAAPSVPVRPLATEPHPSSGGQDIASEPTSPMDVETSEWRRHAAAGQYTEALAAADREGFDQLLQELPPADLLQLADVARLNDDVDRAREALLTLRERQPSSRLAHMAAFRLGRISFESSHDFGQAARWFRTVIEESPGGPHTADARGRLMEALARDGRAAEAVEAAHEYLRHHPGGAYSAAARSLVGRQESE